MGNIKETGQLDDLHVDGMVILISKKEDIMAWIGFIWLRIEIWGAHVNTVMNICVPYNAEH